VHVAKLQSRRGYLVTSAALGAEETVEHLLQAVEVALLDIPTCLEPISEDGRARTIHQRLPRHLHLAACTAKYVAQDLAKNVPSGRLLRLPRGRGTSLSGNADLDRAHNDRLETPIANRFA
jgi:hypothetical protein